MKISKLFVAALFAAAVGASAQGPGATDLPAGSKTETDGDTFTTGSLKLDDVKTFNAQMDTNFAPPAGGNKPGDSKPGGNNPAAAPAITLTGVTGVVQIKTAGGVMTVKAGEPIPVIPAGSEIVVVSGDVTVSIGAATIKANAGDSFVVNVTGAGAADIAVTGGSISVASGNAPAKEVGKNEGIIVAAAPATPDAPGAPGKSADAEKPAAPESIPADAPTENVVSTPPPSSPTQESTTVSPSAP